MLSTTPRPFATLIPSRDHKEAYLHILAWLMRDGWVTQLRTFAWVRVPSDIMSKFDQHDSNGAMSGDDHQEEKEHASPDPYSDTKKPSFTVASSTSSASTAVPLSRDQGACIITNPRMASAHESRLLAAISGHVQDVQGDVSRAAWEKCVRHFDGQHAVEDIGLLEGWKKKQAFELIAKWVDLGILLRTRHW